MTRKASGRSALIIAAGFLLCVSGPLRATEDGDGAAAASASEQTESAGKPIALGKFTKHHRSGKQAARTHKPGRVTAKGYRRKDNHDDADAKAIDDKADDKAAAITDINQTAIPDNVANANAQWPTSNAKPVATAPATPNAQPDVNPGVVAADQLNDLDRTLSQSQAAATAPATPADGTAAPSGADPASQIATQVAAQGTPGDQRAPASQAALMSAMASADRPTASASSDDSAWGQSSLIGKIFIAVGGLLTAASAVRMFMA